VDVFPRGVLGELEEIPPALWPPPAVLTSRWVRPGFYLSPDVRGWLEGGRLSELLWCEEPAPALGALALPQRRVGAVLARRPDECLARARARELMGVEPGERLVLALASGGPNRRRRLRTLLERIGDGLRQRLAVPVRLHIASPGAEARRTEHVAVCPLVPAMEVLRGADVVVAAGGYHVAHETAALKAPAVFIPQRRRYDDQHRRVQGRCCVSGPVELALALEGALGGAAAGAALDPGRQRGAGRVDGASQVAARLLAAVRT